MSARRATPPPRETSWRALRCEELRCKATTPSWAAKLHQEVVYLRTTTRCIAHALWSLDECVLEIELRTGRMTTHVQYVVLERIVICPHHGRQQAKERRLPRRVLAEHHVDSRTKLQGRRLDVPELVDRELRQLVHRPILKRSATRSGAASGPDHSPSQGVKEAGTPRLLTSSPHCPPMPLARGAERDLTPP